jgi:amino acid transporter
MAYDDGMETVEQYQHPHGIELNEYSGMAANSYPGGPDSDEEKDAIHSAANEYETDSHSRLHRGLKTRQISMIALGGALGTGLLINTWVQYSENHRIEANNYSGVWLQKVGPGSLLISYSLVGVLCYAVMAAMVRYESRSTCRFLFTTFV